jgi:cysteine desulfurase
LIAGGSQERERRAGTENLAGISGMAAALASAVSEQPEEATRLSAMRARLQTELLAIAPDMVIHGDPDQRLPNLLSISFPGVESEPLLLGLDLEGVCASAGAACSAGAIEPSHVMRAIGTDPQLARGAVRLSLGRGTTEADIGATITVMQAVLSRIRRAVDSHCQ